MMRNRMEVTIEQRQKLTLTPELKQSIEILRYSLDDLAAFVREQALENPMMELEERAFSDSMEAAAETERTREALLELVDRFPNSGSYQTQADQAKESDAVSFLDFHAKSTTLKDDLLFQLHTLNPDPAVLHSARILIDHLNDNGYLKTPLDHIVQTHAVAEEAVREALTLVQTLEPKGVCARNLAECLLLQLSPEDTLPRLLIAEHLEDIAANRLRFIAKERQVSMEKLLEAIDTIKSLNPKPGASYADNQPVQYLIPDATIEKTETGYSIHMHDEYIPTIHISREYRQMIQTGDAETVRFLSEKLRTAEQLMAGISQRKSTIHRVLEVIVRVQAEFLEKGSRFLAPMSQKEVAEELSVHESTVSRATTEKYVYTPQGLFELKYFFSTEMKTEDGEEVSARAIQAMIQDIVNNENKKKPLSDAKITEQLVSEGFAISRRTVAKYREAIGIPKSSVRKAFR